MPVRMRTQTAVSAGGVIVDEAGRVVLTARRSFGGALQWGLPKGLLDPGEDAAAAAKREATEETGFEVEIVSSLPTIDYWYVDKQQGVRVHKFVHYFLMRPTGGDPTAHDAETEEVALLAPLEALERASFRSEREVLRAAAERLAHLGKGYVSDRDAEYKRHPESFPKEGVMAAPDDQEQLSQDDIAPVQASAGASDFPTVKDVDQSDIPHHGAVDPSQPDPSEEPAEQSS